MRELLILADGDDVQDLVPDDQRIRLIHLAEQRTIGEKRNFGCEKAAGEIIAHWDDDDYSAPGRLADQVNRLQETGQPVTGYRSIRFTDGTRCWLFQSNFVVGTSLCYRRSYWELLNFQALQVGEDGEFVLASAGKIANADAGELMHATIHEGNTSPRSMGAGYTLL